MTLKYLANKKNQQKSTDSNHPDQCWISDLIIRTTVYIIYTHGNTYIYT